MASPGEEVKKFVPRSVADTVSGDVSPPGALTSLQNLIWDPSTPHTLICRPANTVAIDFTMWGAAPGTVGVITAAGQVGDLIYGLVGITSGTFNGKDYPFAYNLVTATFVAIASVTAAKCPASQSTTGAWIPPQMTLTGIDFVVTHVGFPGGAGAFLGWFNVTDPTTPTWNVGNTGGNPLPSVPQACGTFNNRTYLCCAGVAFYTDTLAINMTNSNQSLNIGDLTNITCMAPLPESAQSFGIIQGLLVFKTNYITLITGDTVTSNLGTNEISSSVGTEAPRSAVPTPNGVMFNANDGIRTINFWAQLSEPDDDLAIPFIYALVPSRVCAAFNANIYRICVQNGLASGSPYQDYWYDLRRKGWTGPHTFGYDIIVGYTNDFILASNNIIAKMWSSFSVQDHDAEGNTFIENGTQLTWAYQPAPMTDLGNMYANSLLRSTVELASPASGQTYLFTAQNESGSLLAQGSIMQLANEAVWGDFTWGNANWGAATSGLIPLTIPWNQAIVFNKLSIMGQGDSALGFKIGCLINGYKKLKYLLN